MSSSEAKLVVPTENSARWDWLLLLLIPLSTLLVAYPLHKNGVSCGDDFPFHVQSWVDAARQFGHGIWYPRWTSSGAFSAGEPRFTFYPPLSWMVGGLIELLFPRAHSTVVFITFALVAAGFAMFWLSRQYTTTAGAVACAVLYAVNPYMLLNAMERASFAELLAATWVPLLFWGALRTPLSPTLVAVPLCLLWLTNVPTAVGATYFVVLLLSIRLLFSARSDAWELGRVSRSIVLSGTAGVVLGLLLGSFFIVPAAYERRYIQVTQLFAQGYRIQDGFLFHYTGQATHDQTNAQTSHLVLELFLFAVIALAAALYLRRKRTQAGVSRSFSFPVYAMGALAVLLLFTQTSLSLPLWSLPELTYMQFPWRLLTILSVVAALSLALALNGYSKGARWALAAALIFAAVMSHSYLHHVRRFCIVPSFDTYLAQAIRSGHGMRENPEYTPANASDLALHTNNPGYWLADSPDAYAPGTSASPNPAMDPNYAPGVPSSQSLSQTAPTRIDTYRQHPEALILNLRAYPTWKVTRNGAPISLVPRPDGLIAMELPAGHSVVQVHWQRLADETIGICLSLLSAIALVVIEIWRLRGSRIGSPKIFPEHPLGSIPDAG